MSISFHLLHFTRHSFYCWKKSLKKHLQSDCFHMFVGMFQNSDVIFHLIVFLLMLYVPENVYKWLQRVQLLETVALNNWKSQKCRITFQTKQNEQLIEMLFFFIMLLFLRGFKALFCALIRALGWKEKKQRTKWWTPELYFFCRHLQLLSRAAIFMCWFWAPGATTICWKGSSSAPLNVSLQQGLFWCKRRKICL